MRLNNSFKKKSDFDFKSKYEEETQPVEEENDDPELFGLEIIVGTPPTEESPYVTSSPASFVADMVKRGANAAGIVRIANKLGLQKKKIKLLLEARGMPLQIVKFCTKCGNKLQEDGVCDSCSLMEEDKDD